MALQLLLLCVAVSTVHSIDNGLGRTPPMGWRSWNLYGANVNQSVLQHIMDGMVSRKRQVNGVPTSLCDLGYCDVGLDDNWQDCKGGHQYSYHDDAGIPIINTDRFPDMVAMTSHAHQLLGHQQGRQSSRLRNRSLGFWGRTGEVYKIPKFRWEPEKHMKLWVSEQNQGANIFRFLGCIAIELVNVCHWSWNRPRGVPLLWTHRHGEISCQKPPTGPGAHQCHFNKHVQDGEEQQNLRKGGATILTIFIFFFKIDFSISVFPKNI